MFLKNEMSYVTAGSGAFCHRNHKIGVEHSRVDAHYNIYSVVEFAVVY